MRSHLASRFALFQVYGIAASFFILGVVMKINGYPHATDVTWSPLASFLRHYGLWFLLLPLISCLGAALAKHRWPATFADDESEAIIPVATAAILICLFLVATFHPKTPPKRSQAQTPPTQTTPSTKRFRTAENQTL